MALDRVFSRHDPGPVAIMARYLAVAVMLTGLTAALLRVLPHANPADAALTYLLLVLAASTLQDVWLGAFSAALSVLALNYFFLPPVGTLTVADPSNWFALVAFLVTSIVTSQLVARARQRSRLALEGERLARALLALSDSLASSLAQAAAQPAAALVDNLARACALGLGAQGCLLQVSEPWQALARYGDLGPMASEALAVDLVVRPGGVERFADIGAPETTWVMGLGQGSERVHGTLTLVVPHRGHAVEGETVRATARLATMALERAILAREAAQAEAVRQSESLKTALLSGVSHELRTPLAAIRLSATALQRPEVWRDAEARAELLDALDQEAARLNARVGSLLAMSRVESGSLVLDLADVNASEIVSAALRHLGPTAQADRLRIAVAQGLPAVRADVAVMGVALANLVDNALKYAPSDTLVEIGAAPEAGSPFVRLAVSDRGPGLAPAERERVFERFYRAGTAGTRRSAGTGLGLSITRALVEAHGGGAWAEGRPGGGSVFCLTVPQAAAPRGAATVAR